GAEGKVIVLVAFPKGDILQAVQNLGSAFRIAEIPIVFVISRLRKVRVWTWAPRFRRCRLLRLFRLSRLFHLGLPPSRDTRDKHESNRKERRPYNLHSI